MQHILLFYSSSGRRHIVAREVCVFICQHASPFYHGCRVVNHIALGIDQSAYPPQQECLCHCLIPSDAGIWHSCHATGNFTHNVPICISKSTPQKHMHHVSALLVEIQKHISCLSCLTTTSCCSMTTTSCCCKC